MMSFSLAGTCALFVIFLPLYLFALLLFLFWAALILASWLGGSGEARKSPLLRHSVGTVFVRTSTRSAEAYRGVWGHPLPEIFTSSQVGSEAIYRTKCKSLAANSYDERMRLVIHSDTAPFDSKDRLAPDSRSTTLLSLIVSALHWWGTGLISTFNPFDTSKLAVSVTD